MTTRFRVAMRCVLASLLVLISTFALCAEPALADEPGWHSVFVARLNKPAESGDCPDRYEPNNSRAAAMAICEEPLQSYICSAQDVDFFLSCAGEGTSFSSFVELYDLPADYDLFVYDGEAELGRSTNVGTRAERVDIAGLPAGKSVYIQVVGADGAHDPDQPYTLKYTRNNGVFTSTPTTTATWTPSSTATESPSATPPPFTATATAATGPALFVDAVTSPTTLIRQTISGQTDPGAIVKIDCETGIYQMAAVGGDFAMEIDLLPDAVTHLTVTAWSALNPEIKTVTTVDRNGDPLEIMQVEATATATPTVTELLTWTPTMTPWGTATPTVTRTPSPTGTFTASPTATPTPSMTPIVGAAFRVIVPANVVVGIPFDVEVALRDAHGTLIAGYRGSVRIETLPEDAPVSQLPQQYTFTEADQGRRVWNAVITGPTTAHIRIRVRDEAMGFEGTSLPFAVLSPTATSLATSTASATSTATAIPSATATRTMTRTPTLTRTWTSTATPTDTVTPSTTATATVTPTDTLTPTITLTPTVTATPTATSPYGPFTRIYQQGLDGYGGTEDTTLREGYHDPTQDPAFRHTLVLVAARDGDLQSFLIRFDVSDLPAFATVTEASLDFYVHPDSTTKEIQMLGYRVLRRWNVLEATWSQADAGLPWDVPGCNGVGTDRELEPEVQLRLQRRDDWISFPLTQLVQDWVANPLDNHGLLFRAEADAVAEYRFNSGEFWLPELRPRLTVRYQILPTPTPTDTPTPTSTRTPTPSATPSPTFAPGAVILQQGVGGYTGTTDVGISSWDPNGNYDGSELILRTGNVKSALLRFDLSAVPPAAIIQQATLRLYVTGVGHEVALHSYKLLVPWVEREATWLSPQVGEWWALPGANGLWTDRAGQVAAEASVTDASQWVELDLTPLVQEWVETGQVANHGLLLKLTATLSTEARLASSEYWHVAQRPQLAISYVTP